LKPPLIDIHHHILPGVDDGAVDLDMTRGMLHKAVEDGVQTLVLTPHLYEPDIVGGTEPWREKTKKAFDLTQELVQKENIPLELKLAAEVRYQDTLFFLLEELPLLIGDRYLLLEFAFHYVPLNVEQPIRSLLDRGVIPIIAHPERIKPWRKNPEQLATLINLGCLCQVDIGSLLGTLGERSKRQAEYLLEEGAVHLLGSDSHNLSSRPVCAREGFEWIVREFDTELAKLLLHENPMKLLRGEIIYPDGVQLSKPTPSLREKMRKWIFFNS